MQMQPATSAYTASPSRHGSHRGFDGQQCKRQHIMCWARHRRWSLLRQLAVSKPDHTSTFNAAQSTQRRQTPGPLHSVSALKGTAHAGRASTQLAAGNFMGLMGQILKDMSQAVPSGSSLTVDHLSYHPAGKPSKIDTLTVLPLAALHVAKRKSRRGHVALRQPLLTDLSLSFCDYRLSCAAID